MLELPTLTNNPCTFVFILTAPLYQTVAAVQEGVLRPKTAVVRHEVVLVFGPEYRVSRGETKLVSEDWYIILNKGDNMTYPSILQATVASLTSHPSLHTG